MRTDKVVTEVLGDEVALTPSDVFGKKFKRALFGGYDRRQVDRFLERVADTLERLLEQVRSLRAVQLEQKARLEEYRDMENTLRTALGASQKLAEDVLATARREAQAIVEEGRVNQARLEMEGRRLPEELRREIRLLEQQRDRLRAELSAVLETHRRLLDGHLPKRPALPSLTNLEFGPCGLDESMPIFAPEPEAFPSPDLPEAMVLEEPDRDAGAGEEPEPPDEALNARAKSDAVETEE